MSKRDELERSLENEDKQYSQFLENIRPYVDLIPSVQARQNEVQAKKSFVENAPDEVIAEVGDDLLQNQVYDEQQARRFTPQVSPISVAQIDYMIGGTSSISLYFDILDTVNRFEGDDLSSGWAEPVKQTFTVVADEKARKNSLPPRLDIINQNLGEMFTVAQESVAKAQTQVLGVDQAAKQLRDVLQQLWGGLANIARVRGPRTYRGTRFRYTRKKDIAFVAEHLSNDENAQQRLTRLLGIISNMASELSETNFMKNPLTADVDRLNELYQRWTVLIDDIVSIVYPSISE